MIFLKIVGGVVYETFLFGAHFESGFVGSGLGVAGFNAVDDGFDVCDVRVVPFAGDLVDAEIFEPFVNGVVSKTFAGVGDGELIMFDFILRVRSFDETFFDASFNGVKIAAGFGDALSVTDF